MTTTNTNSSRYALGFDTDLLRDHYEALIGPCPAELTRDQIVAALKGTAFDEHAFSGYSDADLKAERDLDENDEMADDSKV